VVVGDVYYRIVKIITNIKNAKYDKKCTRFRNANRMDSGIE